MRFTQPIKSQCCHHKETTQMIFNANQLTGFDMMATLTQIYSYGIHNVTEKLAPYFFSRHFEMPQREILMKIFKTYS